MRSVMFSRFTRVFGMRVHSYCACAGCVTSWFLKVCREAQGERQPIPTSLSLVQQQQRQRITVRKRRPSVLSQPANQPASDPSRNVGKWVSGTCRGSTERQRHPRAASAQTGRGEQSDRGAGGSVGRRRERKSCGPPGTGRGHCLQMSGW